MDSIARSVGDKSGLINTGDARELLLARMLAASIKQEEIWLFRFKEMEYVPLTVQEAKRCLPPKI